MSQDSQGMTPAVLDTEGLVYCGSGSTSIQLHLFYIQREWCSLGQDIQGMNLVVLEGTVFSVRIDRDDSCIVLERE